MRTIILGLCCGAIGAVISAFFWSVEYHAVARSSPGRIALCTLSGAVFVLTFLNCTSFTFQEQMRDRGTPLVRWAIMAISGPVIWGLHCGGILTRLPGLGSLGLGIAAGWGAGWMLGAPTEPTAKEKRWIVCYAAALVALALGTSVLRSILIPYAQREAATMSVQKAGRAGNMWALSRALKHPDARVQQEAALALGRLGPAARAAVPALIKTLRAKHAPNKVYVYAARKEAAKTLGRIGPAAESAVPALIEVLQDESPSAILVHEAAVTALGDIGQPAELVVPALIQALQRANLAFNWTVAEQAVRALGRLGSRSEPAIPTLLDMLESPIANAKGIPEALIQIGPAATSSAAARSDKLLQDVCAEDLAVRVRAAMSLRKMGPLALNPLLESLECKETQVRLAATRVVGSLEPETQTAVVAALAKLVNDPEPPIRLEAARVLGKTGPIAKQAVPALLEVLKDESTDARLKKAVSQALEKIDPSKHIQLETNIGTDSAHSRLPLKNRERHAFGLTEQRFQKPVAREMHRKTIPIRDTFDGSS
jgi:HEAT repeat protein